VPANRRTAAAFVVLALASASLPVGASALPVGPPGPFRSAPRVAGGWQSTAAVREQIASTGVYDFSLTVKTGAARSSFVRVEIGGLTRRARIDRRAHSASLKLRLAINRRAFTVSASAERARPLLRIVLRRIGAVAAGTRSHGITLATAPRKTAPRKTSTTPGKGTTRASGTVGNPAKNAAAATSSASTPAPGTPAGSTGSSGSTSPPAPPAPPAPTTGPNGNPIVAVPGGFAPVQNYANPERDYEFNGSSLPSDWAAANWSHGFNATNFQPSQVTLTGSSVALTAINQPSGGYPYQSGYISTQGAFAANYGLIDFRAKMPAGQGLWSGLWLDQPDHSNPWGEIDVAEMLLGDTHTVWGSLHNWAPNPYWSELQGVNMAADASQGFHDYQVVWQPGMITWAIDGVAFAQYTKAQALAAGHYWTFDDGTGFYLVADLAVGGPSDWGGPPNASTAFPASVQIQSVRVWD
jgi:Glycosyl hydrolases family 16